MSEEGRLEYVKRVVGFPSAISLVEGKIWVLWDPILNITFSTLAEQLVDMEISFPVGSFFFSAVYARCTGVARRPLWSAMERLASSRQGSWMVAGDFNIITEASERLGRLDRVVINQEWAEMCSVTRVLHLSRGRSDHTPLLIKCGSGRQGKSAFRYLNVWPRHRSFLGVVQESKLRVWNKEVFRNIETRVAELERDMRTAEMQYDTGRIVAAKIVYHEARAAYMKQLAVECGFWRQKSRIKWIQEGDANTAFFHSVVRQRRASNYISGIRSATGQWLSEAEDIKSSAAAFFQALFSSDRNTDWQLVLPFALPQVSQGDNESMLALPTTDEVREVVFSISPDSAPGPDGFGSDFYQACWEIVKDSLVAAIHDYFRGGGCQKE
ncbi:uncharacterized protein [Coffea arabica]|uniref:Reverse transcriptase n=1 Tax=Coffea arabica TaxID=13443 RepID=A0ABM4WN39_COFAR